MTQRISITLDTELAELLLKERKLVIRIGEPTKPVAESTMRLGSLPSRLHTWARERGEPFRTKELATELGIRPRHASVLLVQAVQANRGIVRVSHGLYDYQEPK